MLEHLWLPGMVTVAAIALSAILFKEFPKKRAGTSSGYDYEVFLSFRGPDTRAGFTDFLYTSLTDAGIRTFKDDEDLRIGEEFAPELLQAIKQSKILIPIFSKDYASSAWCLKEVVQMVEGKKTRRQKIMPIFYDVAPSEVGYQTGGYGEAFRSHENKKWYDKKTMQDWKNALTAVLTIDGWDIHSMSNSKQEGQLVKTITQKVFRELKKYCLKSDCLVNVNNHVDAIMELIGVQTSETRIIGIHGMGGIGKTTIAKIIYNRLSSDFENCYFLPNIREMSAHKGIKCLQHQLISGILKNKCTDTRTIDDRMMTMKDRLSNKRVLLLLDDMHEKREMDALVGERNWFGKGSKIVITTRNKEILDALKVDDRYELTGMDRNQSLQLFSKHAFKRDSPLDEYIDQSNKVIDIAKGLPLTLEVIGSLLSHTKKKKWKDILEKLENVPHTDVRHNLKISYDALEVQQKHIFLDIACFFIGYNKDDMVHFWEKSKFFPTLAMDDLQNRSLIKIEEDNRVWMHDQLRDLGRDIVREESNMKIEMQSRVWDPMEASDLLRKHKGKKRIEALRLKLGNQNQYCFSYESLESLSNLRFLEVDGSMENFHVEERLLQHESPYDAFPTNENSNLLPQLRWLSWRHIPPAFNITIFSMEDVVILNLSQSEITDDWKGWSHIKVMKNLKVLDLSSCKGLQRTPIFSSHLNLERLILCSCQSLIEIDASICQLKYLVSLDISYCRNLQRLPDEFGRGLANLKYLSLYDCNSLERLPDSIGNLKSLIKLDISNAKIKELPDSIRGLANLKFLSLYVCDSLERLPDSIGNLKSLIELDISRVKIKELPDSIRGLANLKFLSLSWCDSLERLPDSIGNLESLIKLKIFNTKIKELPDFIGNLKELKVEYIEEPLLSKIPDVLWSMENLEDISASKYFGYGNNGNFHVNIGKGIHRSQSLTTLTLTGANIYELPRLPESLIKLQLSDLLMDAFPDLSNLTNLKEMDLHFGQPHRGMKYNSLWGGCPLRHRISLSKPEPLDLHSHHVTTSPTNLALPPRLDSLCLSCFNLHHLPRLPSTLSFLYLENCAWFFSLEDLSNLKKLSSLYIGDTAIAEIQGLGCLENLRVLRLYRLGQVKILSDLTNLNKLMSLQVISCDNLVEIQGEPQSLEVLRIDSCKSLRKLPNLWRLIRLRKVCIKKL